MSEFSYLGEEDGDHIDHIDPVHDQPQNVRNGRRVRGRDRDWKLKRQFPHPEDFEASNFLDEIQGCWSSCKPSSHFKGNN